MSWLTIAWSMCAAASAMLGVIQLLLWYREGRSWVYPLAAVMAFSASAMAISELALIHSQSIPHYARLLKLENLTVYFLLVAMVWLVYVHMGTARRSLAILITGTWSAAIVMNYVSPGSLVFADISSLQRMQTFWGESYTTATGPANLWKLLADFSTILILVYVIDASVRVWKQGRRERALLTGGSIVLFMLTAGIHAPLVDAGLVRTPYMVSFSFLAIVAAMTYELVRDAVRLRELSRQAIAAENLYLRNELAVIEGTGELIGNSSAIQVIRRRITELAQEREPVLLRGETGSGHLHAARALHEYGPRSGQAFIRMNCASVHPDDQQEELFGKDLAGFMGKKQHRRGRFDLAAGGTLYLEHAEALSPVVKSGLEAAIHEDVRVIVSMEASLDAPDNRFPSFTAGTTIDMPPLRERREDIPELVSQHVAQISNQLGSPINCIPSAVLRQLENYDWPGNLKEMESLLERSVLTSPGKELKLSASLANGNNHHATSSGKKLRLDEVERQHILAVLKQTNWRITGDQGAADLLGLNPSTLRFRMKKLEIVRPV